MVSWEGSHISLLVGHSKSFEEFYLVRGSRPISNHLGLGKSGVYFWRTWCLARLHGESMKTHVMDSNCTQPTTCTLTMLQNIWQQSFPNYSEDNPPLSRFLAKLIDKFSVLFATSIEYPRTQLPEPTSKHPRHNIEKDHQGIW